MSCFQDVIQISEKRHFQVHLSQIFFAIEAEKLFAAEGTKLYSAWESIEEGRLEEAAQLIEELRLLKDAETTARIEGAVKWLDRAYHNQTETKMDDG